MERYSRNALIIIITIIMRDGAHERMGFMRSLGW